jgi:hypothetical protein
LDFNKRATWCKNQAKPCSQEVVDETYTKSMADYSGCDALVNACFCPTDWMPIWHADLLCSNKCRPAKNPGRNAIRRHCRWLKWQRRLPRQPAKRGGKRGVCESLTPPPTRNVQRVESSRPSQPIVSAPDPLAGLRNCRGWIDQVDYRQVAATLQKVRWPQGPACPACGERETQYVHCIDPEYHEGLGRWRCEICAQAGDPGEGGTFTVFTGALFAGLQVDLRSFWLLLEAFADGKASVATARETQVNRHTTDRLRAALYLTRSEEPLILNPEDVGEFDEVYITAGLGGLRLEREPRNGV